ncbi:aldehyde dehydrogenase family protein [Acetobacter sp. LMG 1627]|uniref:Aldehyde dehydrogenase family protein n=1 Tax=Acetobacter conturbans TaxID=1737472 RepID=A0ABX0K5W8_9PROT|nr:aldehyde dehydrogenase family protein [Acetobacter conturbans]
MHMTGDCLIGWQDIHHEGGFRAFDPTRCAELEPSFSSATMEDVDRACHLAAEAFVSCRLVPREQRAVFLEMIATALEDATETIVQRAMQETALPQGRLTGEMGRTTGQLRMFAAIVRSGEATDPKWDKALPDRKPMPRPELRQHKVGVGPVAVFCASNFPLAFSVAGGDTASALAAGCPVVCRAHPAHPGTAELVGRCIRKAALQCGMPEGIFSLVGGEAHEVGAWLAEHSAIQSVAFTGSCQGGTALAAIGAQRPDPIPVFAEMGSINPVFLMPEAMKKGAAQLGEAFVTSLTAGVGQFCTNPGLLVGLDGVDMDIFAKAAASALAAQNEGVMLTRGMADSYRGKVKRLMATDGVDLVALSSGNGETTRARGAFFRTTLSVFLQNRHLQDEVFGPCSLLVTCSSAEDILSLSRHLEGQLTVTFHMEAEDMALAQRLLPTIERKAGRILVNGWPTGVEVCAAMVHGGPFPATTDGRFTSVGGDAIDRFLRPVCYQNFPAELLPDDIRD